jgi:hypothetical protein
MIGQGGGTPADLQQLCGRAPSPCTFWDPMEDEAVDYTHYVQPRGGNLLVLPVGEPAGDPATVSNSPTEGRAWDPSRRSHLTSLTTALSSCIPMLPCSNRSHGSTSNLSEQSFTTTPRQFREVGNARLALLILIVGWIACCGVRPKSCRVGQLRKSEISKSNF